MNERKQLGTSRRAQVVLPADEYALLETYARERGTTVSGLLRDILERTLLAALQRRRQKVALQRLFGQSLPTADWPVIEQELELLWTGHEPA